jgi:hypothetical protein
MLTCDTIARLLRDYSLNLNSFLCKIAEMHLNPLTIDHTLQEDIHRMHPLLKNVETKDNR